MSDETLKLDRLIRAAVQRHGDEPSPWVIAKRLAMAIPDDQLRKFAVILLADRVRMIVRTERVENYAPPESDEESRPAPSKWERHAHWIKQRVHVGGEWKFVGDCTAEDCDALAEDRAKRAAELHAWAERFRTLAARLRETGAATVADLDPSNLDLAA